MVATGRALAARRNGMCTAAAAQSVLIAAPDMMRVVDLHRPAALNALNHEMVSTLLPLVQNWQQVDGDVKLVIFRGAGGRAFCAGGDIRALRDCAMSGTPEGRQPAHSFFRDEYALNHAIGTSRTPIVSILEGIVMGGGVGLSVHGQVRVASESTVFAMPVSLRESRTSALPPPALSERPAFASFSRNRKLA